jgi:SPP1 family predicted phage head-tail adaptor
MTIAAGKLSCKITFQTATDGENGYSSETTKTWADDFTKWANIETTQGSNDSEHSDKQVVESTHIVTCHYSSKITSDHRISHNSNTFEILGEPQNVGYRNIITKIYCKEVLNA